MDSSPLMSFEGLSVSIVDLRQSTVLMLVLAAPLEVLIGVLDHRQDHDEGERGEHGRLPLRNRDHINHLHEHDQEEVQVGELVRELLEQIVRNEAPPGVLGSANRVVPYVMSPSKSSKRPLLKADLADATFLVFEKPQHRIRVIFLRLSWLWAILVYMIVAIMLVYIVHRERRWVMFNLYLQYKN